MYPLLNFRDSILTPTVVIPIVVLICLFRPFSTCIVLTAFFSFRFDHSSKHVLQNANQLD